MRIAVCDDEKQVLETVTNLLDLYRKQTGSEILVSGFENAMDLLQSMEQVTYDLLLLDVQMPGIDGIKAAREIRLKNDYVKLVFLTSSPEYAVESYSVQATNYLLKPVSEEKLFSAVEHVEKLLKRQEDALVLQTQGSVSRLPYCKIEYVEVMSKKIYFYLSDGSCKNVRGHLSDYEPALLSRPEFCKIHRSYLVNFASVSEVRQGELLTVLGKRLPIARSVYQKVRTAYTEYMFHIAESMVCNGGRNR